MPGFSSNKSKKKENKPKKSTEKKGFLEGLLSKKREPEKRNFKVSKDNSRDELDFGSSIDEHNVVSTDRNTRKRVVLNTFVMSDTVTNPKQIDIFITNSIALIEAGKMLIPWIIGEEQKDSHITKSKSQASADIDFSDEVDDTNIISIR
jgi:hypothetical protein